MLLWPHTDFGSLKTAFNSLHPDFGPIGEWPSPSPCHGEDHRSKSGWGRSVPVLRRDWGGHSRKRLDSEGYAKCRLHIRATEDWEVPDPSEKKLKQLGSLLKHTATQQEWRSGSAFPCQGKGREFESRLLLLEPIALIWACRLTGWHLACTEDKLQVRILSRPLSGCGIKVVHLPSKQAMRVRVSPAGLEQNTSMVREPAPERYRMLGDSAQSSEMA